MVRATRPPERTLLPMSGRCVPFGETGGTWVDILVTSRRDAKAASRFFRTLFTGLRSVPQVMVTDKLAGDWVAPRRLMPGVEHRRSTYLNITACRPRRHRLSAEQYRHEMTTHCTTCNEVVGIPLAS
jgi:putative transposase